ISPAERTAHSKALLASHVDTILVTLRKPNQNPGPSVRFAESLVAYCKLVDPPEAARVFEAFLPTLHDVYSQSSWRRYGPIHDAIFRLDEAVLRRLLEHPLAVGGIQRIILDALGEQRHCTFRNTWDYLDRTGSS